MKTIENRPRDKEGKFVEFSPLGEKTLGVRLFKEDQDKILELASERGKSATELVRQAVREWLKQQ